MTPEQLLTKWAKSGILTSDDLTRGLMLEYLDLAIIAAKHPYIIVGYMACNGLFKKAVPLYVYNEIGELIHGR